ncbi:hypothetical protein PPERSA_08303 [Pseudocohnilembus persalinus]|uniref:Galactose oxidase/kelch, beta-propeller n=1 Tax=Pseudocohnilembus persalinus TaxID=266149 RepID=A0A0V0QPS5_PSEPJ|nr:hypothetical protein PPERSA_08303 [Pseudocohnilembus persalinus]|eukprot:KRX04088.1 hypothetical protein PPERSA_08303 [Pseudocohnilembus persalinus]
MSSNQSEQQQSSRINLIKQEKNLNFVQTNNLNAEKIDDRWAEFKINGQLISRRSNHSQAVCDGVLYVYGGYDEDNGMLQDFYGMRIKGIEQYNWEKIPIDKDENHPGPRKNFTLLTYQNKLYLFGGQKTNTQNTRALHVYDTDTNQWQYLLQDEDFNEENKQQQKEDSNQKSQKSLFEIGLPPQIDSQGGGVAYPDDPEKAQMIIIGGFVQPQGVYTNAVISYSFKNNSWKFLYKHNENDKHAPRPRQGVDITINNDKVYLFGGNDNQRKFNDLWEFDLTVNAWRQLPKQGDIPEERKGHSLQFYKGYLFLFGGIQEVTKEKNDIFAYDLRKQKWKQILRNTNQYIPAPSPKREGMSPKKIGHSPSKRINSPRKTQLGISPLKKKLQQQNYEQISPNQGISPTRDHQKADNYIDMSQPQNFLDEKKRQKIIEEKQKLLDELDIGKVKYNTNKALSPTSRQLYSSIIRVGDQTKLKNGNQISMMNMENKQRNTTDDFEQNLELYQQQLMQDNQKYKLVDNMLIGKKPCGRDGQSCDLIEGGKLVIFGGDRHLMSFNDTFIFDLDKTISLNLEN